MDLHEGLGRKIFAPWLSEKHDDVDDESLRRAKRVARENVFMTLETVAESAAAMLGSEVPALDVDTA